jgi:hypothetical protein
VFEPGRVYVRGELHNEWDGTTELQRQGGILTPREVPLIVVVTGEEGREFGYEDEWDTEGVGVFHYFGAGQEGDMEFVRGNLALRDHAGNGEDVHLFEQEPEGLRYHGQMERVRRGQPPLYLHVEYLDGLGPPTASGGLKRLIGSHGISERTLQRAAQALGVETERRDFPASTWWRSISPRSSAACAVVAPAAPGQPQHGATDAGKSAS